MEHGSRLMYLHLPERAMHPFGYMKLQGIPRDPTVPAFVTVLRRNVDETFAVYYDYLVLKDVCRVTNPRPWSMLYNYTQWF